MKPTMCYSCDTISSAVINYDEMCTCKVHRVELNCSRTDATLAIAAIFSLLRDEYTERSDWSISHLTDRGYSRRHKQTKNGPVNFDNGKTQP